MREHVEKHFFCGRRAVAQFNPASLSFERCHTSTANAINGVSVRFNGRALSGTPDVTGNRAKIESEIDGVLALVSWFVSPHKPAIIISVELRGPQDRPSKVKVEFETDYNLGYKSGFRRVAGVTWTPIRKGLAVSLNSEPQFKLAHILHPAFDLRVSDASGTEVVSGQTASELRSQCCTEFNLGAGESRTVWSVVSAGFLSEVEGLIKEIDLDWIHGEWEAQGDFEANVCNESATRLVTPDPVVNEHFDRSRCWLEKNVRDLWLGPPFGTDLETNKPVPVLVASPDYPGVFANDCIQTIIEGGAMGPRFLDIALNSLRVLYEHRSNTSYSTVPEAVEQIWHVGMHERTTLRLPVFIQDLLRIGSRQQWVMGASAFILWSGKGEATEYLYPRIQGLLDEFVDNDGDDLDEWDVDSYPEQPQRESYDHECLYGNVWWVKAYEMAAEVAQMNGDIASATRWRTQSAKIMAAIERVFGAQWGYHSWINDKHEPHPHIGHNQIQLVHWGLVDGERADQVFLSARSPEVWLEEYGPRRSDTAHPIGGGGHVWNFMRWKFITALFRYNRIDEALNLWTSWAEQERGLGYQAQESWPTAITGATGQGYTWSAGRAMRVPLFGLFGLEIKADGLYINPRLPSKWTDAGIRHLWFRGTQFDIVIERHRHTDEIDGQPLENRCVGGEVLDGGHHLIKLGAPL